MNQFNLLLKMAQALHNRTLALNPVPYTKINKGIHVKLVGQLRNNLKYELYDHIKLTLRKFTLPNYKNHI